MSARTLMIQGTASHVGKSTLVAALCRLYARRGVRVAPFKAQNMSNNSFVTPDGREIGRAQAVQAAACRLAPHTDFNPVLIKPTDERSAQLVVNGRVSGVLSASDFGRIRREHEQAVHEAFARLVREFDLVILEGAGSPAEINLRDQDIVNMRMAQWAGAPVLLVGDIDRGGVFAALVGTWTLLMPEERRHLKGFLINKFRGEASLLKSGIRMLEAQTELSCLGVLPHWDDLDVPEEDSLGWEAWSGPSPHRSDVLTIGVADLPTISNFTDFETLGEEPDAQVIRVNAQIARPLDALIFPGTKNTARALHFVRTRGLDRMAARVLADGGTLVGICGGYQMLGRSIDDPLGVESSEREMKGLGLLDVTTTFSRKKILVQVIGKHLGSGCPVEGYQIHMGRTSVGKGVMPLLELQKPDHPARWVEGAASANGRTWGTYVHGLFDSPSFRRWFLNRLRMARGWNLLNAEAGSSLDQRLDRLADFVVQHVPLAEIDPIIEKGL